MKKLDEQPQTAVGPLMSLGLVALITGMLYLGYDILMPMALAGLFGFLLWPLVRRVRNIGVNNGVAVTLVTGAAAAVFVGLIVLVSTQIVDVTASLPQYKENLANKVRSLKSSGGNIEQIGSTLRELQDELTSTSQPTTAATNPANIAEVSAASTTQPVSVIIQEQTSMMDLLWGGFSPVLGPLGTAAMVFVLLFFILIDRDHIQDRLEWLTRRYRLWDAVEALDDAAERVGRYLRMQAIVNISYGVIVSIAMLAIGLPNALLWGVLACVLRYVPYIGPWMAAVPPILLSVAFFPDWTRPLIVAGAFILAETLTNGIMEPMLYGSSTGVSTIGVVAATFFWGWVWGAVGLVLAMPITVCLVVIGRHIAPLAPLSLLLSSDVLSPRKKTLDEALETQSRAAEKDSRTGVDTETEAGLI